MITQEGFEYIHKVINNNLEKPRALVNGRYRDGTIQKTEIVNGASRVYCYFDETIVGQITKYQLMGRNGSVFLEKQENIQKDGERGILVLFEFKMKEVIIEDGGH